jgi:hypothetical protein
MKSAHTMGDKSPQTKWPSENQNKTKQKAAVLLVPAILRTPSRDDDVAVRAAERGTRA